MLGRASETAMPQTVVPPCMHHDSFVGSSGPAGPPSLYLYVSVTPCKFLRLQRHSCKSFRDGRRQSPVRIDFAIPCACACSQGERASIRAFPQAVVVVSNESEDVFSSVISTAAGEVTHRLHDNMLSVCQHMLADLAAVKSGVHGMHKESALRRNMPQSSYPNPIEPGLRTKGCQP